MYSHRALDEKNNSSHEMNTNEKPTWKACKTVVFHFQNANL